jgi:ADP-ribose pyrophosphatase YjhB (NUDIX family)
LRVTEPASGPRARLRSLAYHAFYRLSGRWRRRIVRLVKPTYIVGAVTLVRDADAPPPGRLLLLRQPPGSRWSLPGGLMERGERPVECAARELAEETGLRVPVRAIRPAVPNAIVHTDGRWIDVVFEADVPAPQQFTVDGDEVFEAAFHRIDALPQLTVPTARLLAHYGIGPHAGDAEALE